MKKRHVSLFVNAQPTNPCVIVDFQVLHVELAKYHVSCDRHSFTLIAEE